MEDPVRPDGFQDIHYFDENYFDGRTYSSDDEFTEITSYSLTTPERLSKMLIGESILENSVDEFSTCQGNTPETIYRELKEFWIYPNSETLPKESIVKKMFNRNDFTILLDRVDIALKIMIEKYVGKYFSSFFNTSMNSGELDFGWNDFGEVTGVIVRSDITKKQIREMVLVEVRKCIDVTLPYCESEGKTDRQYYEDKIEKSIDVNISELSTNPDDIRLEDWSEQYLSKQKKRVDTYNILRKEYLREKMIFLNGLRCFRRSVVDMINDHRVHKDFIRYVRKIHLEEVPLDDPIRGRIIQRILELRRGNPIYFDDGQICREKNDPEMLSFWITRFRDHSGFKLLEKKPEKPQIMKPCKPYKSLLQKNPIARIAKGIHGDPRFKMIVIQIILPGRLSFPPSPERNHHPRFSYVDLSGQIRSPERTFNSNGPSCV